MTTTAIVHLALLIKITLQELLRVNIEHLGSNNYSKNAKETRDSFKESEEDWTCLLSVYNTSFSQLCNLVNYNTEN